MSDTPRTQSLLYATFGRDLSGLISTYFRAGEYGVPDHWRCTNAFGDSDVLMLNACYDGIFETVEQISTYLFWHDDFLNATLFDGYTEMARYIIKHGLCDVGHTIESVSVYNNVELARILLDENYSPDICLSEACRFNHLEMAQLALDHGATNLTNALTCAKWNNYQELIQLLSNILDVKDELVAPAIYPI